MGIVFLALSLLAGALSPAVDVTGTWTGGPLYLVIKQDGDKISGTGGPDKNEQYPFTGRIDGDHLTLKGGRFELDLRVSASGKEIDGTLKASGGGGAQEQTLPIHVTRFDPAAPAAPAPTAFEVATIKPNNSGDRNSRTSVRGGMLILTNVPLKDIIAQAYDVRDFSLSAPDWLDTVRFDIEAKPPAMAAREQMRIMLQSLLVERFKLASHRESKMLSAYALLVAKSGAKLKEVEPGPTSTRGGRGTLTASSISMHQFADWLGNRMEHPVQDKTDLKGSYDIKLEWSPTDEGASANPDAPPAPDASGPSIFTALQEQLGLRLQAQKLPVEVLVIDHIERTPAAN